MIEETYVPAALPAVRAGAKKKAAAAAAGDSEATGAESGVDPASAVYAVPEVLCLGCADPSCNKQSHNTCHFQHLPFFKNQNQIPNLTIFIRMKK